MLMVECCSSAIDRGKGSIALATGSYSKPRLSFRTQNFVRTERYRKLYGFPEHS
jgi:hypothetical protein